MGKRIVLAGGGHAHMTVLAKSRLIHEEGHQVTLISPSSHHYYSGMGPGMLSGMFRPEEIWFNVEKMIRSGQGQFIQDRVISIDPKERKLTLQSGDSVEYDVLSCNVGSDVPSDIVKGSGENVFPVKPIHNLLKARQAILSWPTDRAMHILVIGGGPAGVEITGNLQRLTNKRTENTAISLVAGRRLLNRFPEKVRALVLQSFHRRGIEVIEGAYAEEAGDGKARLSTGGEREYDFLFPAVGIRPSPLFRDSEIPVDKEGAMVVNQFLQSLAYPEIFGGGDCVSLEGRSLEKVGVYAVRQNPVLFHNLPAFAAGKELKPFDPGGRYLLIFNLGDGRGVFWKGSWIFDGRISLLIKNYIDKRFMDEFQLSREREEGPPAHDA